MRAIQQTAFGGPEDLLLGTMNDPVARSGETLIRLRSAALNWHDVLVRQGRYGSALPHVPGADGAGIEVATGSVLGGCCGAGK